MMKCCALLAIAASARAAVHCTAGEAGFDRPGNDLSGSPFASADALACSKSCGSTRVCRQWSFSKGKCWLKNLVSTRLANPDFCSSTRKASAGTKEYFPVGNFTPFTFIQNPWHRVFHHSGQIRSDDFINGLGWRQMNVYNTSLAVTARPHGLGSPALLLNDDFVSAGIDRSAEVHTKSRVRVKWASAPAAVSAEYWQVAEDLIATEVTLTNAQQADTVASFDIVLQASGHQPDSQATATYQTAGPHGSVCADVTNTAVAVVALEVETPPAGHAFFADAHAASTQLTSHWDSPAANYTNAKANVVAATLTFKDVAVSPASAKRFLFLMARGKDCDAAYALLGGSDLATVPEVLNARSMAKEDDGSFWRGAPVPTGNFSTAWKHGVVYDLNTVRLNLRPAVGIFTTEWDAMQIENPRIVLAESSMDFLAMSYADPDKAKEVYLGMFADAIEPNVPCVWETGKPNMVCDDGSVAGTPAAWGNPIRNILSVYQRDSDKAWLAKLYPLLGDFLNFWLANRTMEGTDYQTCRCSWECGQDDEPRWSFNQSSGGSVTDRFRVVEMQAATAHAAGVLSYFGTELGRPKGEIDRWNGIITKYTKLTNSLWAPDASSPFGGWFADFDTLTNSTSPFGAWNMQLAPLFFNEPSLGVDFFQPSAHINASRLATSIQSTFWSAPPGLTPNISFCDHTTPEWGKDLCWTVSGQFRPQHDAFRLDRIWAPSPWTMGEGAAVVGRRDIASAFTERTLDTVYPVMDMRVKHPDLPLPGNAYECWDTALMDPSLPPVSNYRMAEAYGWSSIATVLFLRTIIGFREMPPGGHLGKDRDDHTAFELAPALPHALLGRSFCPHEYGVERLHFQGRTYTLTYTHSCEAQTAAAAGDAARLHARLTEGNVAADSRATPMDLSFEAVNGRRYKVSVAGHPSATLIE